MANERLIKKLLQVDAVRRDLAAFLVRLGASLRLGIANLRRGVPASEQTAEATAVHVELVQKLDDMHHAVHQARAEGVRTLVEDEGLTVSTVAQLMGRPRQLVARLYQQGRNAEGHSGNGSARRPPDGSTRGRGNGSSQATGAGPASAPPGGGSRTRIPPAAQ
jgi:hypothetical protein